MNEMNEMNEIIEILFISSLWPAENILIILKEIYSLKLKLEQRLIHSLYHMKKF